MRQFIWFCLLLACITPGTGLYAQSDGGLPAQLYFKLDPPFVVNIEDGEVVRFMQVNTELQFSDPAAQPLIEKHVSAIRHAIVMLLSGQPAKVLKTAKGKEDLRVAALAEVQKIFAENTGVKKPVIESLYFTGFIIQ
ncbi:MAG: flagellar basal body-associated FliL family protein [Gammaproteobacteria bacterium]|nr:flagellar basal body-associated FliL family protein [Gammaproteobacteria bacterium]MDH5652666.1 flagellar basal body-associated FliL family protein [Gammaproteobacteria bacterium]